MKRILTILTKYKDKTLIFVPVLVLFITLLVLSQFYSVKITKKVSASDPKTSAIAYMENLSEDDLASAQSYITFKQIRSSHTPTGVPEIYGEELGISFDKVQDAVNKVRVFGPTYGEVGKKIVLTGVDLERYKDIGESIACEYCCGAKTLTRADGSAACGCAHSIMMRGLSAYLIQNYPDLSDEYILNELEKWKVTYFPKQTLMKKLALLEKSGDPGIKRIFEEFPDFLPEMVGGC